MPNDEAMKEAETAIVEGEAIDLPEVYDDRKDEATLRDVVTEGVLVPAVGAPQTGWHVDRFPQALRANNDDPVVTSVGVSWLSVLAAAAIPVLRLSYSKLEHRL